VPADLEYAFALADLAASMSLPRFRDRAFEVATKQDGSPVTDVDEAVERALDDPVPRR
jgi:histidinol-phosphatase